MKIRLFILLIIPFFTYANFVTYTKSGGRFGDNLLAYMHAKWVSYKYNIPLGYYPFEYSDLLVLDDEEKNIEWMTKNKSNIKYIKLTSKKSLDEIFSLPIKNQSLYIIPYFPESEHERTEKCNYPYFEVDWNNGEFKSILKKMIAAKKPFPLLKLPNDKTTVALHIRTGGGYDNHIKVTKEFPLKFPSIDFYKNSIKILHRALGCTPLYIQLFTDDKDPLAIQKELEIEFAGENIEWQCRDTDNSWTKNVLEDFFALTQFDCAIHSESNFSLCAGKIADYRVEIMPLSFQRKNGEIQVDRLLIFGSDKETIEKLSNLISQVHL